jgi:ppGpp synthetase/RelA/SpoT-type nucleotidyltranferase
MNTQPPLTAQHKKLIQNYAQLYPEYKKLSQELKALVKPILRKSGIDYVEVMQRAKDVSSFREKIIRKRYKDPFAEMTDLCAVRIICSYPEDVEKAEKVLKKNFSILSHTNPERTISPYKFWYRTHQFEIQLDDKQISKNKYKLVKHFVAEIQVRTVFMDAWATMEHQINYKHEWITSHETKRKLARLSALLELADEELQELSKNKPIG